MQEMVRLFLAHGAHPNDPVFKGVAREIDSWNLDLTQFIGETKIGPVSTFFRSIRSSDKESCEVFIRNISIDVTLHKN